MAFRFGKQADDPTAAANAAASATKEYRSFKARELRAESDGDKRYLSGYAATYNTLSDDLGWGMRERIVPGAFTRALSEDQDVRHLINHDPNLVLGRTKAGTTKLTEDSKGLKFRTLMPDTQYARDLFTSVARGDIDECSFGFVAVRTAWIEEPDPADDQRRRIVRELHDVDLFDVSTVTYPAYPGTNTMVGRMLRADGERVPAELRAKLQRDYQDGDCQCDCMACLDGECEECSNAECADGNCRCQGMRSQQRGKKKTKRVDGEDLSADCFLIVGDADDTSTWKLPVKFSTDEKTKTHLRNALARFNQLKGVSEEEKKSAWTKLVKLCKEHGIDVSEEKSFEGILTPEQIADFDSESPARVEAARDKVRSIQASL